jgi:Zn-dependent M28 family amino/carboxypeptidase
MRRLWLALAGVAACGGGVAAGQREFDGEAALGYVATQVGFGPRVPNTDGHRGMGDWLEAELRRRADSVTVQAFTHVTVDGDTLQLRNFIARFRPEVTDRIVYLAHWDTRPVADRAADPADRDQPIAGANDGASGVAVLLGVADALKLNPPAYGVDLVFVDGEDYGQWSGDNRDVLIGSRYYAQSLVPSEHPLFAVVWDMVGDRDLEIFQEYNSAARAPEVVERVWTRAAELGYGRVFRGTVGPTLLDDHVPLLQVGVRAIDVIDFDYGGSDRPYWHTLEDTLDKVSAQSLKIVGDVAVALLR